MRINSREAEVRRRRKAEEEELVENIRNLIITDDIVNKICFNSFAEILDRRFVFYAIIGCDVQVQ